MRTRQGKGWEIFLRSEMRPGCEELVDGQQIGLAVLINQTILPQILEHYPFLFELFVHDSPSWALKELVIVNLKQEVPEPLHLLCYLPLKKRLILRFPRELRFLR